MGMAFSAEMGRDDRDYDKWLTTLTEASARLDVVQTAVTDCAACAQVRRSIATKSSTCLKGTAQ